MRRYPIVVCNNCGTQYNAVRPNCPGYQCFEATPPQDGVIQSEREYRTGPVISNPEALPNAADSEGKGAGSKVSTSQKPTGSKKNKK